MKFKLLPAALIAIASIAVADLVRTASGPYVARFGRTAPPLDSAATDAVRAPEATPAQAEPEIANGSQPQVDDPYTAAAPVAADVVTAAPPTPGASQTEPITEAATEIAKPEPAAALATTATTTTPDTTALEIATPEPAAVVVTTTATATPVTASIEVAKPEPAAVDAMTAEAPKPDTASTDTAAPDTATTDIAKQEPAGLAEPALLATDATAPPAVAEVSSVETGTVVTGQEPAVLIETSQTVSQGSPDPDALMSTNAPALAVVETAGRPVKDETAAGPSTASTVEN